ncbi:hypothetical protein L484_026565 [Morus notabilis]|uniref:Uncharacterized protein n=1 Tax=Morus notabilis TaxID=981085 RepID=W9QZ67_9ROSA|nr:hypothetical protein L484_026565 [Morus notabilis]
MKKNISYGLRTAQKIEEKCELLERGVFMFKESVKAGSNWLHKISVITASSRHETVACDLIGPHVRFLLRKNPNKLVSEPLSWIDSRTGQSFWRLCCKIEFNFSLEIRLRRNPNGQEFVFLNFDADFKIRDGEVRWEE